MTIDNLIETSVSLRTGELDRSIFSDTEIFETEIRNLFGRAWLFLCHESQIPETGDFFESVMGRDNVLVVRQKDASIKALLNSCAHRGNAVCRAEEGNARSFLCTYHGWSYGIDGRLKGVPGHKNFYRGELDKAEHGLGAVAQVDTYKGFVFGTHDADAPPLADYLGAAGRLGIDLLAAQGELVVVPGIQKFVIDCNWKIAQDNLFDWYHPQVSHASTFYPGVFLAADGEGTSADDEGVEMEDGSGLNILTGGISGTVYDQAVVLGVFGHGIGGPTSTSAGNVQPDQSWRETDDAKAALGPVGHDVAGHPSIFPTLWVVPETNQLSLRIPRSPNSTEIWWFTFVPRDLDDATRRFVLQLVGKAFGPAGLLEQDDGENWAQATEQSMGTASRDIPHLLSMGLGHGDFTVTDDMARFDGLTNEYGQLWTYHTWQQFVAGKSWDDIRAATLPPEAL